MKNRLIPVLLAMMSICPHSLAEKIDDTHFRYCVMDDDLLFTDQIAVEANNKGNLSHSDPNTWTAKPASCMELGNYHQNAYSGYYMRDIFFKEIFKSNDINLIHNYYIFGDDGPYKSKTEFNIKILAPTGVEFTDYPEKMNIGESATIYTNYKGDYPKFVGGGYFDEEISCSNPDVISYRNGSSGIVYLSANKTGKAMLTLNVYAKNKNHAGSVFIGSHSIDIEVTDENPPESISLTPHSLYVAVGKSEKLYCYLEPAGTESVAIWESSDTDIANVSKSTTHTSSDGKTRLSAFVNGKKRGTCTVTCTTHNGLKATCVVKVMDEDEFEYSNVCIDGIYYNFDPEAKTAEVVKVPQGIEPYKGEITIPSEIEWLGKKFTVAAIGENAFSLCEVSSVKLSNTLKQIKSQAFMQSRLTYIDIPDGTESIAESSFKKCELLESVYLGKDVNSIGLAAFAGCSKLTGFYVSDENTVFKTDDGILYDNNFKTVKQVPGGKKSIAIRPTVESIGAGAFLGNKFINTIIFPEHTKTIEEYACADCPALKEADIPNEVILIGDFAFSGCKSIRRIKLGKKVTLIGESAFDASQDISDIYVYSILPPQIDATTFANYNATLHVPVGRKGAYATADHWRNFKNIEEFDMSGIENLFIDNDDESECRYFNLSGVRINTDALAPGLYIKRQGSKAEKILVK